tara:strand:- start:9965 stop:10849 length:885 start_codon:yes stop_codon:yes gene_type:complete
MIEEVKNPEENKNPIEKADSVFEQAFKNNAAKINEVGGSLSKEFFDVMQEDVKAGQQNFNNAVTSGDKGEKAKALMKLNQKSSNVQNFKETWKMVGESAVDGSLSKGMSSADKFTLAYTTDPNNKPISTEEGFVWKDVEMPDGTKKDINQADMNNAMVLRDDKTSKEIMDLAAQAGTVAKDGGEIDPNRQIATVKKLINPENIKSLMHDDILNTNSSFIEDVRGAYNNPELEDAITNPNNPNYSEEFTNEVLADYFSKKIQQEYDKNKPKEEESKKEYGGLSAQQLIEKYKDIS